MNDKPTFTDADYQKISTRERNLVKTIDDLRAEVERQQAEIARLTKCLKYEQHLINRVGTHGPNCYQWGPAHYQCALGEIGRLQATLGDLPQALAECKRIKAESEDIRRANLDVVANFNEIEKDYERLQTELDEHRNLCVGMVAKLTKERKELAKKLADFVPIWKCVVTERDVLKQDAARYWGLRAYMLSDDYSHDDEVVACTTKEQFDAVIDAAMLPPGPQESEG